jgi:acetylornithine aminotransferase/acetylornithine/N-succinyldiaminopimelate aminotransferase
VKELLQPISAAPAPAPLVHNQEQAVRALFDRHVVPSYARFDLVLSHGAGSEVWDVHGRRFLDLGGGIAVCALGHAHPEVADTLATQARRLLHVSNLYYQEPQGRLAQEITRHLNPPGKVFFANSGAEANEGMYKLARKFGHAHPGPEGPRYEVISTINSFHGRTLGGIAATGQEKVKTGFGPMPDGFRCDVPFNDLAAMEAAVGPRTAAILIEGIQGEGGITPASVEYLKGLRRLCDDQNLLLMIDAVQCGHFRSGCFQSFHRVIGDALGPAAVADFAPDVLSMAKSLGGGFPIGAFWARQPFADLLGPGTHGTTYGGTPLGCAVALKIFEIIERDGLAAHVRATGDWLHSQIESMAREFPGVVRAARGLGFMLGIELAPASEITAFAPRAAERAASLQLVDRLHQVGILTIPSGTQIVRLLPALNLPRSQAEEGIDRLRQVVRSLA